MKRLFTFLKRVAHYLFPEQYRSFREFLKKAEKEGVPVLMHRVILPVINSSDSDFSINAESRKSFSILRLEIPGNEERKRIIFDASTDCLDPFSESFSLLYKKEQQKEERIKKFLLNHHVEVIV